MHEFSCNVGITIARTTPCHTTIHPTQANGGDHIGLQMVTLKWMHDDIISLLALCQGNPGSLLHPTKKGSVTQNFDVSLLSAPARCLKNSWDFFNLRRFNAYVMSLTAMCWFSIRASCNKSGNIVHIPYTPTKKVKQHWMVKLCIQKLQQNLNCEMYLNCTMYKPNIYTIWYIEYNSIFDKIGMRKYPLKCFSGTVSLKDTSIETQVKFPQY